MPDGMQQKEVLGPILRPILSCGIAGVVVSALLFLVGKVLAAAYPYVPYELLAWFMAWREEWKWCLIAVMMTVTYIYGYIR
jgi:hypothetical protein